METGRLEAAATSPALSKAALSGFTVIPEGRWPTKLRGAEDIVQLTW